MAAAGGAQRSPAATASPTLAATDVNTTSSDDRFSRSTESKKATVLMLLNCEKVATSNSDVKPANNDFSTRKPRFSSRAARQFSSEYFALPTLCCIQLSSRGVKSVFV